MRITVFPISSGTSGSWLLQFLQRCANAYDVAFTSTRGMSLFAVIPYVMLFWPMVAFLNRYNAITFQTTRSDAKPEIPTRIRQGRAIVT